MVLIATVICVCLVLLVLGFLVPRRSIRPQLGVDRGLDAARRAGREAPGLLGRLLSGGFRRWRRAADRSARAGRRARRKLPF